MKKKLVIFLAALMMLSVLAVSSGAVDVSLRCSLELLPGSVEAMPDIVNANVVYDIYKVADAIAEEGVDSYYYRPVEGIELSRDIGSYDVALLQSHEWDALAQEIAGIVIAPDAEFEKLTDTSDMDCGLYLVIAHGSDIEDYFSTNDEGEIVTIAESRLHTYTYKPQLISLPSRITHVKDGISEELNTVTDEWIYNVVATMKVEEKPKNGSLLIEKTLWTYEDSSPVTFVFSVEGRVNGELVYSDVVSVNFDAPGVKTILISDEIPIDAVVTVTEIYSGAGYRLTSEPSQQVVISGEGEEIVSVSFENDYNGERINGYGILNHFTYENDSWSVDNTHDSTAE